MAESNRTHLAVSPVAKIGAALAGLVLLAMLGVLVAVLGSLEATRAELRTTRQGVVETEARIERLAGQIDPVLGAAQPLLDAPAQRRLRRTGRQLATAADGLPELATRARQGVDAAVFLARTARDGDLAGTLRSAQALADAGQALATGLDPAAASRLITRTDRLLATLDEPGPRSITACDDRLRTGRLTADGHIGCLVRTVPNLRALLRAQLRANRRSVGTQNSQLSVNRRQLSLFSESIGIQRQLLVHLRSLDRKSGGTAPDTPAGP